MRMALVEGHHRALPVEQLGEKFVERCNPTWWTVYILDRKFSSLIGSPHSVNDEDVTAVLWDPMSCSQDWAALSLHVKISQVISRGLNSEFSPLFLTLADHAVVYSVEGRLGGEFLRKMRSVLQEMDALTGELEDVCARRFSNSIDALSGVTTRLTLSCHSVSIPAFPERTLMPQVYYRDDSTTYTESSLGAAELP